MRLPEKFASSIQEILGDEYECFKDSLLLDKSVSIRLNKKKLQRYSLVNIADTYERVLWSSLGYYLSKRYHFTFDPLFHTGCYYVQEASSMYIEHVIRFLMRQNELMKGGLVLDLCAAPGGKSTHISTLLSEDHLLIANEVNKSRANILSENIAKWGSSNIVVTQGDASRFKKLKHAFNLILADVPCSGEGMFRKDPKAIEEWTPANVELCWKRQREIVSSIWPTLKPGGFLIYSTCTYNTLENENNVSWFIENLGAENVVIDSPKEWNITGDLSGQNLSVARFFPHKTRGEGFFIAVLKKPDEIGYKSFDFNKKIKGKDGDDLAVQYKREIKSWLNEPESLSYRLYNDVVYAFPKLFDKYIPKFREYTNVLRAGIPVAELKGKKVKPHHSLALNDLLKLTAFPSVELSYEGAIAYLRREAISLNETAPLGYVIVTYRKIPLGFVKNLGIRANNLYPVEWKIRSSYIPDQLLLL